LSLEWKSWSDGKTESDSGYDETDELRELDWEEWEKEWSGLGWRNRGRKFISKAKNKRSVIFKEKDEERVSI